MNLLGLCATKRSGKDTFADYLCENYGYVKYSFAGPLKKACAEIFMLSEEQVDGIHKETIDDRWDVSARTIFQKVGTEMFRDKLSDIIPEMYKIQQNFWVYRFKLWYANFLKQNPNGKVVVSDVRFENEVDVIRELNGSLIKINRNTHLTDNHASEQYIQMVNADIELENNSDLKSYYKKIDKLFQ